MMKRGIKNNGKDRHEKVLDKEKMEEGGEKKKKEEEGRRKDKRRKIRKDWSCEKEKTCMTKRRKERKYEIVNRKIEIK